MSIIERKNFFVLFLLIAYAIVLAYNWDIQLVDSQGSQYSSIDVDTMLMPHIAYSARIPQIVLRYAYKNNTGWQIQNIAENCGKEVSMKLGHNQSPQIAHINTNGNLLNSYFYNGNWKTDTIDQSLNCRGVSLALDNLERPAVSYVKGTEFYGDTMKLCLAKYYETLWNIHTISYVTNYGTGFRYLIFSPTSLLLDNMNQAQIGYGWLYSDYVSSTSYLHVSRFQQVNTNWMYSEIYYAGFVNLEGNLGNIVLKSDCNNRLHALYGFSGYLPYIHYAYKEPNSGWQTYIIPDSLPNIYALDLDIDSLNRPNIVYTCQNRLMYAIFDNGNWILDTIVIGNLSGDISLKLDRNNNPHICFFMNGLYYCQGTPTCINENWSLNKSTDIILYPNPSNSVIYINKPDNLKEIRLYNTAGRLIKTFDTKVSYIDIRDLSYDRNCSQFNTSQKYLSDGIYFISLRTDSKTIIKKIIIVRTHY